MNLDAVITPETANILSWGCDGSAGLRSTPIETHSRNAYSFFVTTGQDVPLIEEVIGEDGSSNIPLAD